MSRMKNKTRILCFVLFSSIVFLNLGVSYALDYERIWSNQGISPNFEEENWDIISPDKTKRIFMTSSGLSVEFLGKVSSLNTIALPPLFEIVWIPDSSGFALNFSDGGAVGTWSSFLYKFDQHGNIKMNNIGRFVHLIKGMGNPP